MVHPLLVRAGMRALVASVALIGALMTGGTASTAAPWRRPSSSAAADRRGPSAATTLARLAWLHLRGMGTPSGWSAPLQRATPAIVFIHGLGSNPGIWRPMQARLRTHGLTNVGVLRYVASKTATDQTVADLDRVVRAARRAGHARVVLVGHSMGAIIASYYALAHPDRVSLLVAIASPLRPTNAQGELEPSLHRFVQRVARRAHLLQRLGRGALVKTSRDMQDPSETGRIRPVIDGELGIPFLSVVGRADSVVTPETARVVGPLSRTVTVDGTHLGVMLDRRVADLVAEEIVRAASLD